MQNACNNRIQTHNLRNVRYAKVQGSGGILHSSQRAPLMFGLNDRTSYVYDRRNSAHHFSDEIMRNHSTSPLEGIRNRWRAIATTGITW